MKLKFLLSALLALFSMFGYAQRPPDVFIPPFTAQEVTTRILGQTLDYWVNPLRLLDAHQDNKGHKAVVFILDTSGKWDHEDILPVGNRFAATFTGEAPEDGNGHGHFAGGCVAALDNQLGVLGVAPDVLLVPVKVMGNSGSGYSDQIAKGIRYAADVDLQEFNDRIRILSMSFGGSSAIPEVQAALQYAEAKGCIAFASAGNEGYTEGANTIGYPARYDDLCVAVGAVGESQQPSYFSSSGTELDITSFGENILLPSVKSRGYARVSGTSFSDPLTAGVGALIVTKHYEAFKKAGANAQALMERFLELNAKDLLTKGWDNRTGAGLAEATMLLNQVPKLPDLPTDPGNPDPPAPTVPVRAERTITVLNPTEYSVIWKPVNIGPFDRATVTVTVDYKTKYFVPTAVDTIVKTTTQFFTNRGFVLLANDDLPEAAYWIRYFLEMYYRQNGFDAKVNVMVTRDPQRRAVQLTNTERRSTSKTNRLYRQGRVNQLLYGNLN